MLENQLEKLGLHKNETKVYLALFELGKVKAGQIIEQTGLHRNLVYTALEELVKKLLVSKVDHSGVAMFSINSPELLREIAEEQVNIANEVIGELKKKHEEQPRDIIIYEGEEGLKRSRNRVLSYDPGDTMYVIGSKASSTPEMEKYWRKFHSKRVDKGIGLKILYEQGVDPEDIEWRNKLPLSVAKYLPLNIDMPIWFSVIKDYLEIGIPGENLLTFGLRSSAAAGAIQRFFEYFWNQEIRVETGVEALERVYANMLEELSPGEEYCNIGASDGRSGPLVKAFYDNFHISRIKKGVRIRVLAYKESFEQIRQRYIDAGDKDFKLSEVKMFINAPFSPIQTVFYHNKMFMCVMAENPTVIYFDQPEIAKNFKLHFEQVWNQRVSTESGVDILKKTIYEMLDELKTGEEYFVLGASVGGGDERIQKLYDEFHADRIKKGVAVSMLVFKEGYKKIMDRFNYCGDPLGKVSRAKTFMSAPPIPMQINIFKNKTFFILYGEEPTVTSFDQPEIAQVFKNYFDELWNQETQVLKGAEALRELWLEAIDCGELRWIGAKGYFIARHPEIYEEIKAKAARTPGVVWKNIVSADFKGHPLTKLPWMQTKYNLGKIRNPNAIWLFGDKVLVVNWAEDVPVIFQSTNKQLVQTYSDYFDELWKKGE